MRIGADYYPEHWEKERWKTDFELMNQAHIKVVRIGEFTWSLYEPVEGKFDFSWMDEALDALHEYGIKVVLCTPSATPPKWMIDRYPDILQRDIYGRAKLSGTRKHYCFNSSVYRKKCHILNTKIAERYGHHPAVEAWQVDNELGWSNTTRCYCDECQDKFRFWLKQKYKTIDRLNEKYGTVVWSQIYNGFDEVNIPRAGACYESCHDTQGQNPGLLLDYYRFCSDSVVDFTKETCEDIRAYSSYPISTNMLDAAVNSGTGINYFDLSEKLDFATWDNYIEFQWGVAEDATVSRDHALIRSYKKKPFWVMEQQAGACGWSKMGPTPTPGKLRLWTYSAVANGADTVVYFRWRTALFGLEQYWHGILNHDGKPGRRYEEISQIGREMELLNQTVGTLMPKARVAIIKSFDSEWSHSIHRHVENFQYDNYELSFYRAFYRLGIAVDFISEKEDMSGYDLVFAPALIMADTETVESLSAYVKNGGSLLLTFRSGIKDEFNAMLPETVPGVFAELAGIQVNDYDPQMEKQTTSSGVFGEAKSTLWCDIIEETTARPLGVYTSDFYAGKSCMTVNEYGNGEVYYLGCDLDDDAMLRLAE
ncbi:MAG: beta-galactosidase [Lachnospiraceae bacterium]|nr:beta-galactosidase [Lachnospiraceae bacterium]